MSFQKSTFNRYFKFDVIEIKKKYIFTHSCFFILTKKKKMKYEPLRVKAKTPMVKRNTLIEKCI